MASKAPRVNDQPQPRFFEQILSDIAAVRQPDEKAAQPRIVGVVHGIERGGVSRAQSSDELQLELAVHHCINAGARET